MISWKICVSCGSWSYGHWPIGGFLIRNLSCWAWASPLNAALYIFPKFRFFHFFVMYTIEPN